ncbi:hypothetical protein K435DRAFT_870662 [Dendrothele bispora CBS 962.96]|uniref:Uncharacterized protein n=1 Tax=Dendrothele bispora (strain CBS 962.96) TaxID=1314807 RepID=A0A4S8L6H4_DENBC|nr:hypothetical protein K435DRAFT_870662 [Dendrothele bispora CBS 962.96]
MFGNKAELSSNWDLASDLPSSFANPVAVPPASPQQDQPLTQPPLYSAIQNLILPRNQPLVASPTGFGFPQATRSLQFNSSTPKNQPFGQPSTLLQNIAGTPVNMVNLLTPSSSRTVPAASNLSAPPISTLSAVISPVSSLRHGSFPFLTPKPTASTSTAQNPIAGPPSPRSTLLLRSVNVVKINSGTTKTDVRVVKKPKLIEETSEDESSESAPEPKMAKGKKPKKKSSKKMTKGKKPKKKSSKTAHAVIHFQMYRVFFRIVVCNYQGDREF